ncbi:MAG: DNA replication/repair protein RecF [Calditrichia bacterium]
MRIDQLECSHFRNINTCSLTFYDGIHIFHGKNGQGKTNLLESIYYLAITKSFRQVNEKKLVQLGHHSFEIKSSLKKSDGQYRVRAYWDEQHKKNFWLNNTKIDKIKDFIGFIPVVILVPDDLSITQGGPQQRRRYMDVLLSQSSTKYLNQLMKYRNLLKSRYSLFQQEQPDSLLVETITTQLAETAFSIIQERIRFIQWLKDQITPLYNSISGRNDLIKLHYLTSFKHIDLTNKDALVEFWLNRIPEELEKRRSACGIHLDDFMIYLNGKAIRNFGSQGENKTMVIALKIAEYHYLQQSKEDKPLLLFDDIFGELDGLRINKMLHVLEQIGQVFITTASRDFFNKLDISMETHFYSVENGHVYEEASA